MGSYNVSYDAAKKRVYCSLEGIISLEDAQGYVSEFEKVCKGKEVKSLVSDVKKSKPMPADIMEVMGATGDMPEVKNAKFSMVVDSAVYKVYFEQERARVDGMSNSAKYFKTLEDAEKFLDE